MEDYEETFNYDYDDNGLTLFLFSILKKLDTASKRSFLAMFLKVIFRGGHSDPLDPASMHVCIDLSEECKLHVESLLENADLIFSDSLSEEQRELYQHVSQIKSFMNLNMTAKGYMEFLNRCNNLARLTGLPFSLEEEYGGLKTWDAWNTASEKAMEDCKEKFGRKSRKK